MVIDTTIFIEYLRAKDRTKTIYANLPVNVAYYVSDVTVFELYSGATDTKKWHEVEFVLEAMLRLPFNHATAVEAAKIHQDLRRRGLIVEFRDIFIAATCLVNNLPLKTLNVKDFSRIPGVQLV